MLLHSRIALYDPAMTMMPFDPPTGVELFFVDGQRHPLIATYRGWEGEQLSGHHRWTVAVSQEEARALLAGEAEIRAKSIGTRTHLIAELDLGCLDESSVDQHVWEPPNTSIWMGREGEPEYPSVEEMTRQRLAESETKTSWWQRRKSA